MLFFSTVYRFIYLSARSLFPGAHAPITFSFKRLIIMLALLPVFTALQACHWAAFLLDDILFRGYRRLPVRQPLFITGVPRSGTTLLHLVLAQDSDRFTTPALWELILAPSITERKIWYAIGRLDRLLGSPGRRLVSWMEHKILGGKKSVHHLRLHAPEEDFLLLVPVLACFILVLLFPFEPIWRLAYFDEQLPRPEQDRILGFYKRCLQRHLYVHGPEKTILSKNASFSPLVKSLRRTFPDARFVCMLRSPYQTVPSVLSAMLSASRAMGDAQRGTALRDRYVDLMRFYYSHLTSVLPSWPADRYLTFTMDEVKNDLIRAVEQLYRAFGYDLTPGFRKTVHTAGIRARQYRSTHYYSLEQFDLDREYINRAFKPFFTRAAHYIGADDVPAPGGHSTAQTPTCPVAAR